jgi:hypothetical protein
MLPGECPALLGRAIESTRFIICILVCVSFPGFTASYSGGLYMKKDPSQRSGGQRFAVMSS